MCPKHANNPIKASQDHWLKDGLIQTTGTINEPIETPTTPVKSKVNKGLSVVWSLLVIIKYTP